MTQKHMKKQKQHFNDLLLPVILLVAVLPFVIHLATVNTGLEKYLWYSTDGSILDLYAYVRSHFLMIIAAFMVLILVFYLPLYRERVKDSRLFYALFTYGGLAILATIFSVDQQYALTGNLYRYEGMLVLVSYVVICFYTYQMMNSERDYRTVLVAILVMLGLMTVVGTFQIFKHDLLNYTWVQRLIMSAEDFEFYGGEMDDVFTGNNVFLTLFNPNYAGVFLTMFVAFFFVMCMTENRKKVKVCYGIVTVLALILTWFTYSRSTLVALAAGLIVYLMIRGRKQMKKLLGILVPAGLTLVVVLVAVDAGLGFKYLSRLTDEKKDTLVESIYTRDDGVWITVDGETVVVSLTEDGDLELKDEYGVSLTADTRGEAEYTLPVAVEAKCEAFTFDEMQGINMSLNGYPLMFVKQEGTYYYYTETGKLDQMTEIASVDMHGLEYLGSGRLYIWSRTIPLLKNYLLIGSGPDTFAEVFPQNDYVGKMIYADLTSRVMEGAHNMYLTTWVQTGLLSLIALLVFCVLLIKRSVRTYRNLDWQNEAQQGSLPSRVGLAAFLGCVCYLVGGFFNDSTLYTTPMFFLFAGLALAGTARAQNDEWNKI